MCHIVWKLFIFSLYPLVDILKERREVMHAVRLNSLPAYISHVGCVQGSAIDSRQQLSV